ncbi:MAG TPA: FAD-dependent oxidoreductase [Stellaceae bacterium]|jgi:fumarate reductase flavoprotein subunit|nr:FAD-dependent oxidoreductase [Stellaceae bacterium]
MSDGLHFDLVAIGGGFAGLCAALRGAELGLRTAVVEAGADDNYLCSSRWAGGIFHVSYHDVKLGGDELVAAINRQTSGEANSSLAAAIAEDAGRTVDWLAGQGADFVQGSPINWHRFTLAPPRAAVAGQDWSGRGPDRMIDQLRHRLEERQGRVFLDTRAQSLRSSDGRVVGIDAHRGEETLTLFAKAVVIADGGFPGSAELFQRHIGPRPDRVLMRHAGTAIGDGLKMAEAAGAALVNLDRFYGHLLSRDAMENEGLWPYPQIDAVATASIVVDRDGRRLLDEGLGGISITNDLARLDDPLCGTVICDAPIWETAGKAAQIPPNSQLIAGGGTLHDAETLEKLADIAGLPTQVLVETVAAYNAAIHQGSLDALAPKRSTRSGQPRAIETPPFFAIPICAGITNTMGGIAIDGHGRVKRSNGSVIPGLYAAGGATGGLEGGGALGYVGGLIKACVFGLRVAEHAAHQR